MALVVDTVAGVPGVYRQPAEAAAGFPRQRTDVVGFVGVAGPNRLGEAVRVDDWRSYEEVYLRDGKGRPLAPPAGARLRDTVRAFFANGGARCWVVNVAAAVAEGERLALLDAMLGWSGRTGLEVLLAHREVAIVALPELEAWVTSTVDDAFDAPILDDGRFRCCPRVHGVGPVATTRETLVAPLYQPAEVLAAQRAFIERVGRDKWRVFALVTVPRGLSPAQVEAWRTALSANLADADAAALYWPWVEASDKPGQVPTTQPPLGFVAGIFARRDLKRGPHVAPANEYLYGVSAVERAVTDEEHGRLTGAAVNVIRPFPNRGLELWGARTLAYGRDRADIGELGYVNVRRCLTAIERSCDAEGQRVVFEPNQPMTRFVLAQVVTRYLYGVWRAGAFKGATVEESFYVRCDSTNNPRELVEAGQLVCEVGVAIAAPAEFIVFRLGRAEGVVELQEVG
ncbi:MAG: phage tail sheath subtilisin-like domain-containing protein [Kofleriaceae bacterium]